jgi:hypothetical protein
MIHSAQTAGTVAYKSGHPYNSTTSIQASGEIDMCIVTSSVIESQCFCTEPIDIMFSTVNESGRFLDALFATRNCLDRICR